METTGPKHNKYLLESIAMTSSNKTTNNQIEITKRTTPSPIGIKTITSNATQFPPIHTTATTTTTTISSSSPSPHVNTDTTSLEMITPKQSWTVSPSSSIHYHSHVNIIPHDHHLGIGIENDIDIIKTSNKTTNYDIDGQVSSPKTITCTPDGHICNSPVALGKMLHQTSTSSILTAPSLHEHHDSDDYIDPKHTLWNVRKGSHRTMHYHHKLHQKKGCYA